MTNAHLIKLSGMGDTQWSLIDDTAWGYLESCILNKPIPIPDSVITDSFENDPDMSVGEASTYLTMDTRCPSADNDVAMSMGPSKFNGETFCIYDPTISELNYFVNKHNLTLHESYDGYLY
jgi:hypothetical protein